MFSSGKHSKLTKHGVMQQIDRPLSSEANRVIREFRGVLEPYRLLEAANYISYINNGDVYDGREFPPEEIAHAREVLRRYLAVFGAVR